MTPEQLRSLQAVASKTSGLEHNHVWWLHAYHEDKCELHTAEDNTLWQNMAPLLEQLEEDTGLPRAQLLNSLVLWTRGDGTAD